jgi:preprotein translocase subunit YajC
MLALIAQTTQGGNPLAFLLPFALIGGVFYFLLIRPQQRRAKAQQALVAAVEVGDEIVTTGGVYGTVTGIDDEDGTLTVEIAPGTQIKMMRGGVGRRLVDDVYEDDEDDEDDADGDEDGEDRSTEPHREP